MILKILILILFTALVAGSIWTNYSDSKKTANFSEEEFIEKTLESLGYPSYASASSAFRATNGEIYLPIKNFYNNQTVNPFGVYRAGRFVGYHSGVDIEIEEEDLDKNIPVYSIYGGEVTKVGEASGYGGVVAIKHNFEGNKDLTSVYGHLRLRDIKVSEGQKITSGYLIGYLGAAYTSETAAERKHLHFGLSKNSDLDIKGYVDTLAELSNWLNPRVFMTQANAKERE
ncbi:MAG: M23 family metallopeptidase [bacterium]|nr:M23 family metallopeptidase [bacterium]